MEDERKPIIAFTLDFETGGLDCQTCACAQIAIHAVRIDTFEIMDRYVAYIKPYNKQDKGASKRKVLKKKGEVEDAVSMLYEDKALSYSDISMDTLRSKGKDISDVASEVIEFIKANSINKGKNTKPFLIGQNIIFDIGFFQQLMEYGNMTKEWSKLMRGHVDFYGNFQPLYIDTIILGQFALCTNPNVSSYKLEIMAENLGIELDDAHDADADVAATTAVAAVCAKRMRNSNGGDEGDIDINKKDKTRKHFKI